MNSRLRIAGLAILAALTATAVMASPASAGRFIATGHDVDDHCGTPATDLDNSPGQCHFMGVATNYVRGGAPNPNFTLLLLDCSGQTERALDAAFSPTIIPRHRVCPSEDPGAFNALALSTDVYSAIIVGSSCDDDNSINLTEDDPEGCDEPDGDTPDSDLINARAADIHEFFNAGGGLFAMSGAENGDGDPTSGPDVYYDFVPIGIQGEEVTPPFCLTTVGIEIGFHDQGCDDASLHNGTEDDINCCPTHNSFSEPPAETALEVAERDDANFAETLAADGIISGGQFVEPVDLGPCGTLDNPVTISGTLGDDEIEGTPDADVISGGPGNDLIRGLAGSDVVCGHGGTDQLVGGSDEDTIRGGKGNDRVKGGGGNDKLRGQTGKDRLNGGKGNDRLVGNKGADRLKGGPGKDRLNAGPGHDRLNGGPGKDRIKGKGGNDRINAVDAKRDKVNCGPGKKDRARVDQKDRVARNCERVTGVAALP